MYKINLTAALIFVTWQMASCKFFHIGSAISLGPGLSEPSDFGFSLGFFNNSLVIGDPSRSRYGFGNIYKCPLSFTDSINCSLIEVDKSRKNYTKSLNANQNFYLGATFASTDDYIFTCAPLATMEIEKISMHGKKEQLVDAFGSCFIHYNGSKAIYMDKSPVERHQFLFEYSVPQLARIEGGIGWNSLADKVNGLLLIAKTSMYGDINYLNIKHPLENYPASAQTDEKIKNKFGESWNVGYGMAAGKYFSTDTVYAISMQTQRDMKGEIIFLDVIDNQLQMMYKSGQKECKIGDGVVNTMFGYALASTDINLDGFDELLVGAPAQSDGNIDSGAVYIYLGGNITSCGSPLRMKSIFAEKEYGRFGTTVAAADIDGDSIAEIFVSAPYEDSGVVYVLSGYELRSRLVKQDKVKKVWLSELKLTQKIQQALHLYGFSVQVLPDVDGNGYKDLAIGSPGSASVTLLRSYQTINITISLQINGSQIVKEDDSSFTVNVCLYFGYKSNITGDIHVTNTIDSPVVRIPTPTFTVHLTKDNKTERHCEPVLVNLIKFGSGDYKFVTKLKLEEIEKETKEFDTAWAVLSPYSETMKSLNIPRHCKEVDCNPKLSMSIESSMTGADKYILGTSTSESVHIVVLNQGHIAYGACVKLQVRGAQVLRLDCGTDDDGRYKCFLTDLLKKDVPAHMRNHTIEIQLDMKSTISNLEEALIIEADLYPNCDESNYTRDRLEIPYSLSSELNNVNLGVKDHDKFYVTDREVSTDESTNVKLQYPLKDIHDFLITNKGIVTWNSVSALILVEKTSFINNVTTTEPGCGPENNGTHFAITCELTLQPSSTKEILLTVYYDRKELGKHLPVGGTNVTSNFILYLSPTNENKSVSYVSPVELRIDMGFSNNKHLIIILAIFGAVVILLIIAAALIRSGFFKRKEKQRLNSLRESARKRSFRLDSERRQSQKASVACGSGLPDVEVIEENVFGEVSLTPPTTDDDVMLVEAEAEVHVEKCI